MTVKLRDESITKAHEMLPKHMVAAMINYFEKGYQPGDFLSAILANDLVGAFARADHINKPRIEDFINWLYWEAPGRPFGWGSYEAVREWVDAARMMREGEEKEAAKND